MSEIKEILTNTRVSIVGTVLTIYTRFIEGVVDFLEFFIKDQSTVVNDISFSEGELGYTKEGRVNFSASVNDLGELFITDDVVDNYFVDGNGDLIYGEVLVAPVTVAATDLTSDSFKVNLEAVVGAIGYRLDVGLDAQFNKFLTGHQNKDLGNVAEYLVSGLTAETTYYYRVRAYNTVQISQSSNIIEVSTLPVAIVTDPDGNVYDVITIGAQQWLLQPLKTTKYRDDSSVKDVTQWVPAETDGSYAWYNEDIANKAVYGALYNWYAATNPKGIAPIGWRVATRADFDALCAAVGGSWNAPGKRWMVAGGKLKEAGLSHWNAPNTDADNAFGFTALPGGNYWPLNPYPDGFFSEINGYVEYWMQNPGILDPTGSGQTIEFGYDYGHANMSEREKWKGHYIRCVKDI